MIVRDNERTLEAALSSIKPWVDEMVVVDTGSKDRTPEIAKRLGARVFQFPWCDDFSAARNESLRHARGQWLFWMDSDDTIDAANGRKLRELADQPLESAPMAYIMQVHCPGSDEPDSHDITVVDHVKMFRNLPELRFEGRIHEQVLPAVRRLGGEIQWTDIHVVHSGSDQTIAGRKRKQERDLRLLELELQDHPDHPFALFNLGMTYADMHRHDEAVAALRRSLAVADPHESHIRKAYALLVGSLVALSCYDEAAAACQAGRRHYPEDAELAFRAGIVAQHRGDLHEAEHAYRAALSAREDRHFSSIDAGIGGFKARHNLASVYSEQGRRDLAELQWRLAVEESPGYRQGWRGLGETLIEQHKYVTAAIESDHMLTNPKLQCEARVLKAKLARVRGDCEAALREIEEAAKDFPDDVDLLRTKCLLLFEAGEFGEAEEGLRLLCQFDPNDAAAYHNLASVLLQRGATSEAIDACQQSLTIRPNSPQTLVLLGHALMQLGARKGALDTWRSALRLSPNDKAIRNLLAKFEGEPTYQLM